MRTAKCVVLVVAVVGWVVSREAAAKKPGKPEIVATGMGFVEGPSRLPDRGGIVLVDISQPGGIIWKVTRDGKVEPWVKVGKRGNNGSKMGPDGWLYVCNSAYKGVARVRRDESGDKVEWLVTSENAPLNGPNDLVFNKNGDFYFTDPAWGQGQKGTVYLRRKSGELVKIISDIVTPNGIGLSPDEKTLYVASSRPNQLVKCAVKDDGTVGPPEDFVKFSDPGEPDGMRVDSDGTIYQALYSARAIVAISPEGKELWRVPLDWDLADKKPGPHGVTNLVLGRNSIYITRTHAGGDTKDGCLIRLPLEE